MQQTVLLSQELLVKHRAAVPVPRHAKLNHDGVRCQLSQPQAKATGVQAGGAGAARPYALSLPVNMNMFRVEALPPQTASGVS
jgi:hypothetical protein